MSCDSVKVSDLLAQHRETIVVILELAAPVLHCLRCKLSPQTNRTHNVHGCTQGRALVCVNQRVELVVTFLYFQSLLLVVLF